MKNNKKSMTYRDAGVDIDAGNQLIEKIKPFVAKTHRAEAISSLGIWWALCSSIRKVQKTNPSIRNRWCWNKINASSTTQSS